MKFYEVTAKCGHVGGINKYILINFYTQAENGREAAEKIRHAGRVQHDKKDAIQNVKEINLEDFLCGIAAYDADPYNRCHNPQEQRQYCGEIEERVQTETIPAYQQRKPRTPNPKRARRYGYDREGYRFADCYEEYCA